MKPILFAFPGFESLADLIASRQGYDRGDVLIRHFPDGESLVQLNSSVQGLRTIVVCGLDQPDTKIMALMFFASLAREYGATSVDLIAPYLGYMRQDKRFHPGEAVTSEIFARFLSQLVDSLVTVDPHLHRHKAMGEIYSIPTRVIHASRAIAQWIKSHVSSPVLIGPDEESEQWVKDVAQKADAPFLVLRKIRHGDRDVEVSVPEVGRFLHHTPILVDDIISTARTMIETTQHLENSGMKKAICIGVHGVFAGDALSKLQAAHVDRIVTCNTIQHQTNEIDLSSEFTLPQR